MFHLPPEHPIRVDMSKDTSNPFIARDIPSPDESMVVIRFAKPKGIDFQYLLA